MWVPIVIKLLKEVAPVPPWSTATVVPSQVPLAIVPNLVIAPAPWYLGYLGNIYGLLTILLTLIFIYFSWNVYKQKVGSEPILFKYSILYLFLLFMIMPIDKYLYLWIN